MSRADNDTWNITESVGSTALGVAAARAMETDSDNPLITDPFAKLFLEAAGPGMWSMFSGGMPAADLARFDPQLPARMQGMRDYIASRTAFFDEFFLDAAQAGVRQAVILAAGLDARAWRLAWPAGACVYELDQPAVLEFKTSTLLAHDAHPTAEHINVAIDLRDDWPTALRQGGFDPSAPTAWSAEGLLPYLPAAAQDLLFERVQELSAPGSRIAVEAFGADFLDPDAMAKQRALTDKYRAAAAEHDLPEIPNIEDLLYLEDRADVADWLRGRGWDVSVASAQELMAHYHRTPPADLDEGATPQSLFVKGALPG